MSLPNWCICKTVTNVYICGKYFQMSPVLHIQGFTKVQEVWNILSIWCHRLLWHYAMDCLWPEFRMYKIHHDMVKMIIITTIMKMCVPLAWISIWVLLFLNPHALSFCLPPICKWNELLMFTIYYKKHVNWMTSQPESSLLATLHRPVNRWTQFQHGNIWLMGQRMVGPDVSADQYDIRDQKANLGHPSTSLCAMQLYGH